MHNQILALLTIVILNIPMLQGQKADPTETMVAVDVVVTDFSDKARAGEIIYFEGKSPKQTFTGKTDKDGKFSILLPKNNTYLIKYKNFSDSLDYNEMEVTDAAGLYEFTVEIKIEPPKVYVLEDVHFDFGKATLRKESFKSLNDLVEVMKIKSSMIIEIAGHTDNIGKPEDNMILSEGRANTVRNYLLKQGIESKRVFAKGYGDTQPVADNSTEQGRQLNRRTEVRIISE